MIEKLRATLARHEFLKHVLQLMSGTGLAQLLTLACSPIVSRLYTPAELGVFTLFVSFSAVLVTIATGRYAMAIVLPDNEPDARALVGLSRRISRWTCLVSGLLLLLLAELISQWTNTPQLRWWLPFVGLFAWVLAQVDIYNYWCIRRRRYKDMAINRMTQSTTLNGTQIGFGLLSLGATGVILSTFLGQVAGALTFRRKVEHEIADGPVGSQREMAREHRKMPLLNTPTALLDNIRLEGTPMMIAALFSTAAVGQYGWAWRILQTPAALINSSLSQVFYKSLATTPRGEMSRLVARSAVRSLLIGLLPFGLLFLLSPMLIPFVFGAKWQEAGLISQALVPWLFVNFITSPISTLFIVTKRQELLLWYAVPLTLTPFAVLLSWRNSIVGASWALSLAMTGMLLVYLCLAFFVAKQYDQGHGAEVESEEAEAEMADEAADVAAGEEVVEELTDDGEAGR